MQVKNIMEEAVCKSLDEILRARGQYGIGDVCCCERCLLDIQALALNRLPARYVVSDQGEVFARAVSLNSRQFDVDILHAVLMAVSIVAAHPRH